MRHRMLADLEGLRDFVGQNPGRLAKLIRRSFEAERGETANGIGTTTMRMPPFMRNSNAGPLTLATWQYDLLMDWVKAIESQPELPAPKGLLARRISRPLSESGYGGARRFWRVSGGCRNAACQEVNHDGADRDDRGRYLSSLFKDSGPPWESIC